VQGGFATLAKRRAEALQEERTRRALVWLEGAEAPRPTAPRGPGMPGQRLPLDVDDLKLPGATGITDPAKNQFNIDEFLKDIGNLGKDAGTSTERYPIGDAAKTGDGASTGESKEAKGNEKPAETPKDAGETPKGTPEKAK
jgi:hypothetical protein